MSFKGFFPYYVQIRETLNSSVLFLVQYYGWSEIEMTVPENNFGALTTNLDQCREFIIKLPKFNDDWKALMRLFKGNRKKMKSQYFED